MIKYYLYLSFFCLAVSVNAAEYPLSAIPAELMKNAHSVLRYEAIRFEIISTKETVETRHYAITILNDKHDAWAYFSDYYDMHREIVSVDGRLFDASGREIRKMKRKDLRDESAVSSNNLIDDNRSVGHNFYHRVYPYTVEYIVKIKNKSSLFFPGWTPQGGEFQSVENSTYTLISPENYSVRYKTFNYNGTPKSTSEKGRKILEFSVKDLGAIKRGAYSPAWHELTTMAIFGPSEFQVDNYKGNMKAWRDFGLFVHDLRKGRDQLPPETKAKVRALTEGLSDPVEKINRLYKFMQQNTRYISIQLGIGGWQPFPASDVATKGYGDCKALTNYMYSLLKEIGIESYYALIRAGDGATYITEDFPAQQFNHVILSVPVGTDTVWLECTSQTQAAGYLGSFTGNRPALLVNEEGGQLVRTPAYGIEQNLQTRNISAVLDAQGDLTASIQSRYSGLQQDRLHDMIHYLSKEKQKEILVSKFDFATYDVNDFNYEQRMGKIPEVKESLEISVNNYGTITGKRLFLNPNLFTRTTGQKLEKESDRRHGFSLSYAYRDIDTVKIKIPEGYSLETRTRDIEISTAFGIYRSGITVTGDSILYYRQIDHLAGKFSAGQYNELVDFYAAIHKADRERLVFVKN